MKIKQRICKKCPHPRDDHSSYRDRCLHSECECTENSEGFNPDGVSLSE